MQVSSVYSSDQLLIGFCTKVYVWDWLLFDSLEVGEPIVGIFNLRLSLRAACFDLWDCGVSYACSRRSVRYTFA